MSVSFYVNPDPSVIVYCPSSSSIRWGFWPRGRLDIAPMVANLSEGKTWCVLWGWVQGTGIWLSKMLVSLPPRPNICSGSRPQGTLWPHTAAGKLHGQNRILWSFCHSGSRKVLGLGSRFNLTKIIIIKGCSISCDIWFGRKKSACFQIPREKIREVVYIVGILGREEILLEEKGGDF